MTAVVAVTLVLGLVLLVVGAELLVRGASKLAAAFGIPPLIVGLTVVAFGTSSPELAVSVQSALGGSADLALGNVVGSNIFNVLFILGLSALITPLSVQSQLVRGDVPVMIGVSTAALAMGWDGRISRADGLMLLAAGVIYTLALVYLARRNNPAVVPPSDDHGEAPSDKSRGVKGAAMNGALILVGLVMLVKGSDLLVDGAVAVATALGLSQLVIGLTIVAAGTSLPEVAASVVAALRGERDIAVGNVVGSNIFNLQIVLGAASVVGADGVAVPASARAFDLPVMLAVAVACWPIFVTGLRVDRLEGALFLLGYLGYTTYLILRARSHPALDAATVIAIYGLLPLVVLGTVVSAWRDRKRTATGV